MWHFQRIDPVESAVSLKYLAFVGAGGKTSLIEYLAETLVRLGKRVAITTTTKMYAREPYQVLAHDPDIATPSFPLLRIGKTLDQGKLTAVNLEDLKRLGATYDTVLIEADGAKGRPLKCPAPYEPVIPHLAERTYIVSGLDALYQRVGDAVFRWELLPESLTSGADRIVTEDIYVAFFSPNLLLKGIESHKSVVVLNKYDRTRWRKDGFKIARRLTEKVAGLEVVVSSINMRTFYRVTYGECIEKKYFSIL